MLEVCDDEEDERVGGEGDGAGLAGGIVEVALGGPKFEEDAEGADGGVEGAVGVEKAGVEDACWDGEKEALARERWKGKAEHGNEELTESFVGVDVGLDELVANLSFELDDGNAGEWTEVGVARASVRRGGRAKGQHEFGAI